MHNKKNYNSLTSLAKVVVQIYKIFFNLPYFAELIPLNYNAKVTDITIKYG